MPSSPRRPTTCPRCGARLARDNTTGRCAPCDAAERDRLVTPPKLPAEFWDHEPIRQAAAERHFGRLIRAYRNHPYHGHRPLPQHAVARWLGMTQAQLSRLENRGPVVHLDRLTHWARILDVPPRLLWFTLPEPDRVPVGHDQQYEPPQRGCDFLAAMRRLRAELDTSLATETVSIERLKLIEESVDEHVQAYPVTAPNVMLTRLAADCVEVLSLAQQRQTSAVQARLSGAAALLLTMTADAFMRLGCTDDARRWYRTAKLVADDSGRPQLRVLVRAQAAMLPYYFGDAEQAVILAESALTLSKATCSSTALAAAARARALARIGMRNLALEAVDQARRLFDELNEPDTNIAFRFPAKRFLLYLSGATTWLGDVTAAYRMQDEALALYQSSPGSMIDPALLHLDRAMCLIRERRVEEAACVAKHAIANLPAAQRTELVLSHARRVIAAVPPRERRGELVTLAEYVDDCRSRARTLLAEG